jgi:hypothetical protein
MDHIYGRLIVGYDTGNGVGNFYPFGCAYQPLAKIFL